MNKLTAENFAAGLAQVNLVARIDFDTKLISLNRKVNSIKTKHGEYNYFWKSKGFSDERINSIPASNYSITFSLDYLGVKIRIKFSFKLFKAT